MCHLSKARDFGKRMVDRDLIETINGLVIDGGWTIQDIFKVLSPAFEDFFLIGNKNISICAKQGQRTS